MVDRLDKGMDEVRVRRMSGTTDMFTPIKSLYVVSSLYRLFNSRGVGSDKDHIGVVEYFYGKNTNIARVRSMCGRDGKMIAQVRSAKVTDEVTAYIEGLHPAHNVCRSCLNSWAKHAEGET